MIGVSDGLDHRDEVASLLVAAPDVGGLVNEPGDAGIRAVLLAQLVEPDARGVDEIGPPMIVRLGLEFLPFVEGYAAGEDDIFLIRRRGGPARGPNGEKGEERAGAGRDDS